MTKNFFICEIMLVATLLMGCSTRTRMTESPPNLNNYCQKEYGKHVVLKMTPAEALGHDHKATFTCSSSEVDSSKKELVELTNLLSKRDKAKPKTSEHKRLSADGKAIIENYLAGKCPEKWKSNILLNPLGWECQTEALPLAKACSEGKPTIENMPYGFKTVFCLRD